MMHLVMRFTEFIRYNIFHKMKAKFSHNTLIKNLRFSWANLAICHLTCIAIGLIQKYNLCFKRIYFVNKYRASKLEILRIS